jgi:site-specific DNA-methyltransferase (adenine-specific)
MSPYTLHHGNALTILPTIPAASIDAVITDPPYNSGGRTPNDRTGQTALTKYVSGGARVATELADFAGDNRDQRAYTYWLTLILTECLRVAVEGAPLLVFTDFRQLPATSDALQAAGWTWRGIVPWHKPNARPHRGGFRRACEYVLWATNGPVDAARNPVYLPGLVTGSQPRGANRHHITAKPVDVMRELVRVCAPAGIVLDPFAGSGTTGVAALLEGRHFIGIELTKTYHRTTARRLAEAARQQGSP